MRFIGPVLRLFALPSRPFTRLAIAGRPDSGIRYHKITLLLTELSDAASHATLFLATHEEDRFLPILKKFFDPSDVKAYKAAGLDEEGPHFEDVTIPL